MSKMRTVAAVAAGCITAGVLGIAPAIAHHSTAAFDTTRVIKVEGKVTQFRWINPYASIKVDGVAEGDEIDGVWTIEMTAPNILINQGWTRTALKVGDQGHDVRESATQCDRAQRRQPRWFVHRCGLGERQHARPHGRQGRGLESETRRGERPDTTPGRVSRETRPIFSMSLAPSAFRRRANVAVSVFTRST